MFNNHQKSNSKLISSNPQFNEEDMGDHSNRNAEAITDQDAKPEVVLSVSEEEVQQVEKSPSRLGKRAKYFLGLSLATVVIAGVAIGVVFGLQSTTPECNEDIGQRGEPLLLQSGTKLFVKKFDTCQELGAAMLKGRRCGFSTRSFAPIGAEGIPEAVEDAASPSDGGSSTPSSEPASQPGSDPTSSKYSGTLPNGANFTSTNNQVSGVDEADIIKTDGKYFYSIVNPVVFQNYGIDGILEQGFPDYSKSNHRFPLVITSSWPPNQMNVISVTWFNGTDFAPENVSYSQFNPKELFLEGDRVMIISESYVSTYVSKKNAAGASSGSSEAGVSSVSAPAGDQEPQDDYSYFNSFRSFVTVTVVDVADRHAPTAVRRVDLEGVYISARKVEARATVVVENWPNMYGPSSAFDDLQALDLLPLFRDSRQPQSGPLREVAGVPFESTVPSCGDVQYTEAVSVGSFTTLAVLSLLPEDDAGPVEMLTVAGRGSVYASTSKLFLVQPNYQQGAGESTVVTVFSVDSNAPLADTRTGSESSALGLEGILAAPGTVLNQFSVDHSGDHFRMATTTRAEWDWGSGPELVQLRESSNHVFTFDLTKLEPVSSGSVLLPLGKLVDLAPTETIFSARFIGDRLFLVTYRQVDPLFVIDLSEASEPKLLGELKLPGYSTYLHPMNETSLIGLGRDATDEGVVQGLKVVIFDIGNVSSPEVAQSIVIGSDWGTSSRAEWDHKAFMYQPVTNTPPYQGILAFPLFQNFYQGNSWTATTTLRVYGLSSGGFEIIGDISHERDEKGVPLAGVNEIFDQDNQYGRYEAVTPSRSVLFEVPREGSESNDLIVYSLSGIGTAAHSVNTTLGSLSFESLAMHRVWEEL